MMKWKCARIALCLATAASGQIVNEDLKLTASDAAAGDRLGTSVAISGTTGVVGAPAPFVAAAAGSAYVFDATTGQQLFELTAADAVGGDQFGCSVAVSGTTAVIGAQANDASGTDSGAAYVFDTATGQQLFKLTASDAGPFKYFGVSVAVSGTLAVVGAYLDNVAGPNSGSAYVFDLTTGQQLFKLTASDAAAQDQFGFSVAISGMFAIVGAYRDNPAGSGSSSGSGSAYLFDMATGLEYAKLTASDAVAGDNFGSSVAISGGTALVGAPRASIFVGSAYVFDRATGQQLVKLTPSDGRPNDFFGISVGLSGSTAIVAAHWDDDAGSSSGSAYVFDAPTGQRLSKLVASDGAPADELGTCVSISGTSVIAGAPFDDDAGSNSGSAYVFDVSPCPGDIADDFGTLGADGMVSFGDFLAMLGLIGPCPGMMPGCTGDIADDFGFLISGDGMVSFGDFLALLGLIGPCP